METITDDFIINLYLDGIVYSYKSELNYNIVIDAVSSLRQILAHQTVSDKDYNFYISKQKGVALMDEIRGLLENPIEADCKEYTKNSYGSIFIQGIKFNLIDLVSGEPMLIPFDKKVHNSLVFHKIKT